MIESHVLVSQQASDIDPTVLNSSVTNPDTFTTTIMQLLGLSWNVYMAPYMLSALNQDSSYKRIFGVTRQQSVTIDTSCHAVPTVVLGARGNRVEIPVRTKTVLCH